MILAIWTITFNLVQGKVVAPVVYGRTTNIHPAIVLLAIPAGSAAAGILGMFLVVPVIGVVAATWRAVLHVMGADPPPQKVAEAPDTPPMGPRRDPRPPEADVGLRARAPG